MSDTTATESTGRLAELRKAILDAETAEEEAKDDYAEAKAHTRHAMNEFFATYDAMVSGGKMPLFDGAGGEQRNGTHGLALAAEGWRAVPLADALRGIKLTKKQVESLERADLRTLGQFTDFQTAKETFDWGLAGIGPETRTKIEEALADYWKEHPVKEVKEPEPIPAPGDRPGDPNAVLLSTIMEDAGVSEAITANGVRNGA
jgi:hypothetical protein